MKASKQFLALVLVTCMLTSIFTVVSAAEPMVGDRVWSSDSGYVLVQQGDGTKVNSAYVKVTESEYVKVELSESVEVDLSSGKEDVTIIFTGENLAGSFDLKVLDTENNLVYAPENASPVETNDEVQPGDSDNQKITFTVPPVSMAGGSTLAVYPAGSDMLAWEISYKTTICGSLTANENNPVEIQTVSNNENSSSAIIPSTSVEVILNNIATDTKAVYINVFEPEDYLGSLLIDSDIFKHEKFNCPGFSLNIFVYDSYGYSCRYMWSFNSTQKILQRNQNDSESFQINLRTWIDRVTEQPSNITGIQVHLNDFNRLPNDLSSTLTVKAKFDTNIVNVFYDHKLYHEWMELEKNLAIKNGNEVTFKVVPDYTDRFFIVSPDVTWEQINPDYSIEFFCNSKPISGFVE